MAIKQTAGHDALGKFAPEFAHLNDDILFGEVWSREDKLPLKLRSIVTVSALIGKGIVDSSLKYHLASAKKNGVTQEEIAEILTHIAFYAGWPNAWAAFNMAKEVYVEDGTDGTIGEAARATPRAAAAPNRTAASSAWASPTTPSHSTSSAKAISTRSPGPMTT